MKTEELIQLISHRDILIFGTGFAAEMFRRGLECHDLTGHVRGFMRTGALPGELFHGLSVYDASAESFRNLAGSGLLVCLAVHEAVAREITDLSAVSAAGSESAAGPQMIWVYPCIHELLFGTPLAYGRRIALSKLLEKQDPADHWLDIRYLAAEECLGAEYAGMGERLYIRAMSIHSSPETARKRFGLLKVLAGSMAEYGFLPGKPIMIDTQGRIIDGLHRTAVAAALGIRGILCNIVPASDCYYEVLTERFRLTDPVLAEGGFSDEELALIRLAGERMLAKQ